MFVKQRLEKSITWLKLKPGQGHQYHFLIKKGNKLIKRHKLPLIRNKNQKTRNST